MSYLIRIPPGPPHKDCLPYALGKLVDTRPQLLADKLWGPRPSSQPHSRRRECSLGVTFPLYQETFLNCSLVVLSAVTMPGTDHHDPVPELFSTPKGNLIPARQSLPVPPLLPPGLSTTSLLSVRMDLPVLGISCKWTHTICGLCVWLLSLSIVFSRFTQAVAYVSTSFLLMTDWYFTAWIHHILFICHQLMDIRLFPHFGHCEQCYYKHYCTSFCLNTCFQVWGIYLRVKLLGHMVILHLLGKLSYLSSFISPTSWVCLTDFTLGESISFLNVSYFVFMTVSWQQSLKGVPSF